MKGQHTQRAAHRTGYGPTVQISLQKSPNSSNINPMDYHVWGTMLKASCKLKTKPKTIAKLRKTLQVIWGNLPQGLIDKAVKDLSR